VGKIVVTGASGFIGSHVSRFLEEKGLDVVRISRKPGKKLFQVENYLNAPAGEFLIHLAESPVINVDKEEHEITVYNDLLEKMAENYQKVIYASSSAVYGNASSKAHKVTAPLCTHDNYSKAKLHNEEIALSTNGVVLRMGNIFGSGMSDNNILSDILKQIPGTAPLLIRNDKPVRDFLYINEVCEIINCVIRNFKSGVYNVGSGTGISIGQLARLVLDLSNEKDRTIKVTNPDAVLSTNILDISDTIAVYGWEPSLPLEKQVHAFLKNLYNQ